MLERNQEITWVPEHVRDGSFGKWLENARDWSISRNRFWGSPIPVWKSDNPEYPRIDVYGSLDELERDFGVRPTDLHRPRVDQLTRPNPDDPTGRSTMRRVTDVLDCWFESGSMPFAQVHYPFENRDWFDSHFPGDFIVEYIGQTRGWFYTMHVLAVALFDRPAFKNCLAHGVLLGDDGQKMSKRLRNYPDPDAMFEEHGSDAMRWFLMASPIMRGGDMIVDEKGIREAVRSALLPLWNTWYFFSLYANADGRRAALGRVDSDSGLDRYILASLSSAVGSVTSALEEYDLSGACAAIEGFLDKLTNWYIRRSRDRFWGTSDAAGREADTQAAFDTLATVLEVLCRLAAPLLPLTAESVWTGLVGTAHEETAGAGPARSVHLERWPGLSELPQDPDLVARMDLVREVCSAAHSVRKANGLRARLPLASLVVAGPGLDALQDFADLIADEVNVRAVLFVDDASGYASSHLSVVFKVAAPRLGPATQDAARAARAGDWELLSGADEGRARVGASVLDADEFEMKVIAADERTTRPLPGHAGVVVLDIEVPPVLEVEGRARDFVRELQKARRDLGLDVTDRVVVTVTGDERLIEMLDAHGAMIKEQVLAVSLAVADPPAGTADATTAVLADGTPVAFRIEQAG